MLGLPGFDYCEVIFYGSKKLQLESFLITVCSLTKREVFLNLIKV